MARRTTMRHWMALQSGRFNVVGRHIVVMVALCERSKRWMCYSSTKLGKCRSRMFSSCRRRQKIWCLLGDPQQLERPLKGSHPDGAEKSALEHLLAGHKTISADDGVPVCPRPGDCTRKFANSLHRYFMKTSSLPRRWHRAGFSQGHPWLNKAGLWFVPMAASKAIATRPRRKWKLWREL